MELSATVENKSGPSTGADSDDGLTVTVDNSSRLTEFEASIQDTTLLKILNFVRSAPTKARDDSLHQLINKYFIDKHFSLEDLQNVQYSVPEPKCAQFDPEEIYRLSEVIKYHLFDLYIQNNSIDIAGLRTWTSLCVAYACIHRSSPQKTKYDPARTARFFLDHDSYVTRPVMFKYTFGSSPLASISEPMQNSVLFWFVLSDFLRSSSSIYRVAAQGVARVLFTETDIALSPESWDIIMEPVLHAFDGITTDQLRAECEQIKLEMDNYSLAIENCIGEGYSSLNGAIQFVALSRDDVYLTEVARNATIIREAVKKASALITDPETQMYQILHRIRACEFLACLTHRPTRAEYDHTCAALWLERIHLVIKCVPNIVESLISVMPANISDEKLWSTSGTFDTQTGSPFPSAMIGYVGCTFQVLQNISSVPQYQNLFLQQDPRSTRPSGQRLIETLYECLQLLTRNGTLPRTVTQDNQQMRNLPQWKFVRHLMLRQCGPEHYRRFNGIMHQTAIAAPLVMAFQIILQNLDFPLPNPSYRHPNTIMPFVEKLKDEGNQFFSTGAYEFALCFYTYALRLTESCMKQATQVRCILFSNRAQAHLELQLGSFALRDAESALAIDPRHDKSLKRKKLAQEMIDNPPPPREPFRDTGTLMMRSSTPPARWEGPSWVGVQIHDQSLKSTSVKLAELPHAENSASTQARRRRKQTGRARDRLKRFKAATSAPSDQGSESSAPSTSGPSRSFDEDHSSRYICAVCLDNESSTAVSPCGHVFCGDCVVLLKQCALCREDIKSRIKLFL